MDFDTIYRDYRDYLTDYVARYVRNEEDAKDIMQDTWMRVLGFQVSDENTLCGYLRKVAYSSIVDYYRRVRTGTIPIDGIISLKTVESRMSSDEREHLRMAFDMAIRDLPCHYRLPMERYFFDGMSLISLSNEFGMSTESYRQMVIKTTKGVKKAILRMAG